MQTSWLYRQSKLDDLINPKGHYLGVGNEKGPTKKNGISVFSDEYGSRRYVYFVNGQAVSGIQVVVREGQAILANAFTHKDLRRQGFARKLYERIKKDYPHIEIGTDRSADGTAFVDAVLSNKTS